MESLALAAVSSTARNAGTGSCLFRSTSLNRIMMRCSLKKNYYSVAVFRSPTRLFLSRLLSSASKKNSCGGSIFLNRLITSSERVDQSYVMIKPDGVQRGLVGEIISRFEKKGFKLIGLKLFQCPEELAQEHYKDLQSKPFFAKLIEYITSGPVVCMAWEGVGVVASARKLIGAIQAESGKIRGDFAVQTGRNVVHGSDSAENGEREIDLWFREGELVSWTQAEERWLVE